MSMRKIGSFSKDIIDLLSLDVPIGTPIYIGERNEAHIRERHPYEYEVYFDRIDEIIEEPDYVGKDPRNGSIDYVKLYNLGNDHIQVAIRITKSGIYTARTMFLLTTYNAERYINQGTLIKFQRNDNLQTD